MGGGLFGTPLALNPKCLVFSAFVLFVYWMPHPKAYEHKIVVAFILATASYVLLAWYDVIYDCNDHLKPTILGWMSMPFKPPEYRDAYNELPVKYKKIVRNVDIAVLVVIIFLLVSPYLGSLSK
jgi:hypothetical protein